jgi:hypothetical protein
VAERCARCDAEAASLGVDTDRRAQEWMLHAVFDRRFKQEQHKWRQAPVLVEVPVRNKATAI